MPINNMGKSGTFLCALMAGFFIVQLNAFRHHKSQHSISTLTNKAIIQGEIPGTNCTVDGGLICTCLDTSYQPPSNDAPLELQDILRRGSEFLRNYSDVHEAVLMLGNTGVGKTTATQIIAGNLSKLHAVSNLAESLFIIDEENRIGMPSIKSKTLFPELITRVATENETELAFYDFPGFDDTRGPVQDIAANFFMNEVVKKITSIKMLFLSVYSDVELDNRDNFDKLANHAVEFVKQIEEFNSSFALVVNKVSRFSKATGRRLPDEEIIDKIANFLKGYKNHLSTGSLDEMTRNKIAFVDALLVQDHDESYKRIGFITNPTGCGPLSGLEDAVNSRIKLSQMTSGLNYTLVGKNVDERFGFTLKAETVIEIVNYTQVINDNITSGVSTIISDFNRWYINDIKSKQDLLRPLVLQMASDKESFEKLDNATKYMDKYNTNPVSLFATLKQFSTEIGYPVASKFEDFMYWQEIFLYFFDKAATNPQNREVLQWKAPIEKLLPQSKVLRDWYEFCLLVQELTFTSDFQSKQTASPPSMDSSISRWLDFVNSDITPVSSTIREIAGALDQDHLNVVKKLILFAKDQPKITCETWKDKAVVVTGNFLIPENLMTKVTPFLQSCSREVYFLSSHSTFIAEKFQLEGVHTVIVTPNLASTNTSIELKFDGVPGDDIVPEKASNGHDADRKQDTPTKGADGLAGKPGNVGSEAFIVLSHIAKARTVAVSTSGGKGGPGQHGGNGGKGWSSPDSKCYEDVACGAADQPNKCEYKSGTNSVECFHYGFSGTDAANGGDGGVGGIGGDSGHNKIIYFESSRANAATVRSDALKGDNGSNGRGGDGGEGGAAGKGYRNIASAQCESRDASNGQGPGKHGSNGLSGKSSKGQEYPINVNKTITEWAPILQYRLNFYELSNDTTMNFLNQIDEWDELFSSFTLKGLAEELVALQKIKGTEENNARLSNMCLSLLRRLEKYYNLYFNNSQPQYKKVLTILITSTFSMIQNLQGQEDLEFIPDISTYFEDLKENVGSLSSTQNLTATVHNEKQKYVEKIMEKVSHVNDYILGITVPVVEQAQVVGNAKLAELGQHLEDLVKDDKYTDDEAVEKIKHTEMQTQRLVINILSNIASGLLARHIQPGRTFHDLNETLKIKFANSTAQLERLDHLVLSLEEACWELNDETEYFTKEYAPLFEFMLGYLDEIRENITKGYDITLPRPHVTLWDLQEKLADCKQSLAEMGERSFTMKPLIYAFNRLMDALTMTVDLLELVERYLERSGLEKYTAVMQSAELAPITITDPDFIHAVVDFEDKLKNNLMDAEVYKAIHAFKQYVFPFAKLDLFGYSSPSQCGDADDVSGEAQHCQIDAFTEKLEQYRGILVNGMDEFLIPGDFSGGDESSKPFFTWDHDEHESDIRSLLSGHEVTFDAEVTKYGKDGWDAIKFKLIEINLKLNGAPKELHEEYDELLNNFGVTLTHSGVSYYRFQNDYYVMSGSNQSIVYNFQRDANGKRMGRNIAYEKFNNGDYLMSPYTTWSVQLRQVVPNKIVTNQENIGFESFDKFFPYISIELVGTGTYVDAENALEAQNGDLMLDYYYRREAQLKTEMIF